MSSQNFPDIRDVLALVHGDVLPSEARELQADAFWRVLASGESAGRVLNLVKELGLRRGDIDRAAIIAKVDAQGLTQLDDRETAAIFTDSELCAAILGRIYPELADTGLIAPAVFLVHELGQVFEPDLQAATTEAGVNGWIAKFSGVPAGVAHLEAGRTRIDRFHRRRLHSLRIPSALASVPITTGRLAGETASTPDQLSAARRVYERFKAARALVPPDQRLAGELQGFFVPQEHGARVILFLATAMNPGTGHV